MGLRKDLLQRGFGLAAAVTLSTQTACSATAPAELPQQPDPLPSSTAEVIAPPPASAPEPAAITESVASHPVDVVESLETSHEVSAIPFNPEAAIEATISSVISKGGLNCDFNEGRTAFECNFNEGGLHEANSYLNNMGSGYFSLQSGREESLGGFKSGIICHLHGETAQEVAWKCIGMVGYNHTDAEVEAIAKGLDKTTNILSSVTPDIEIHHPL